MNAITVKALSEITPGADILQLVSDWHAHLDLLVRSGERSAVTVTAYKKGWRVFADWLAEVGAGEVDNTLIREWIASLKSEGRKVNTVNVWLAGVKSFFSWAHGNRRLVFNPAADVKTVSRNGTARRHKKGVLTNEEVKRVLSQPDVTTKSGKRDRALLLLLAYNALRSVEVYRADLSDLRTENGLLVLYVQGKNEVEKNTEVIITNPEVEAALHDWLSVRGGFPGPLFVSLGNRAGGKRLSLRSIRGIVKGYYQAAGVVGEDKTTHSLRHTAITNALENGAPFMGVSKDLARHTNPNTTGIYVHSINRREKPVERFIDYGD